MNYIRHRMSASFDISTEYNISAYLSRHYSHSQMNNYSIIHDSLFMITAIIIYILANICHLVLDSLHHAEFILTYLRLPCKRVQAVDRVLSYPQQIF